MWWGEDAGRETGDDFDWGGGGGGGEVLDYLWGGVCVRNGWSVEGRGESGGRGERCGSYRCTDEYANERYIRITKPVNLQRRFKRLDLNDVHISPSSLLSSPSK